MTDKAQKFLVEIVTLSPSLADAHRETIDYWAPEDPPVTIAYSEIGQRIVAVFDVLESDTRKSIFGLVELGMQSDDEDISTAIATGLIEALVAPAFRLGMWERVRAELGPLSRSHADAWYGSPAQI